MKGVPGIDYIIRIQTLKQFKTINTMIRRFKTMCGAFLMSLLFATFFSVLSYAGELSPVSAADQKQLTGTVRDADGAVLPGATIMVKGTSIGVITDTNGKFLINVPDNASLLTISFVGYSPVEVKIGTSVSFEVKLKTDFKSLQDVVVVGYGSQSKALLTSSVASISSGQLKDRGSVTFTEAMVGQVAGVQVQQTTGAPGGGFSVKVRGVGSITSGTQPLYVVDGVPIDNVITTSAVQNTLWGLTTTGQQPQDAMASINPNDIQSIEILKDASSTAIYGSRGSNGVILITTKQGAVGKTKFSVNVTSGIQTVSKKVDMMNVTDYIAMETQRRNYQWLQYGSGANRQLTDPNSVRSSNAYKIPLEFANPSNFKGTDWQNELFRSAPIQTVQLAVSGGTNKTRFYLSGDFVNQDGIVLNTGFKKFSLRSNVDAEVTDKIKIGFKINPSYNSSNIAQAGGYGGLIAHGVLNLAPTFDAYNTDGSYNFYAPMYTYGDGTFDHPLMASGGLGNPVVQAKEVEMKSDQIRLLSSVYLSAEIVRHLVFKTTVSADINQFAYNQFTPSTAGAPGNVWVNGSLSSSRNINWVNENILTYSNTFNKKHNLTLMGGLTEQKSYFEYHDMGAQSFPNDNVHTLNAGVIYGGTQTKSEWSLLSLLGRVSYDFDKKYLVSATLRRDGSSRFGSENKWGTFPSASVGWRISQENFMENVKQISELKARASYGIVGNNNIGDYGSVGSVGASNYILGSGSGAIVNGLAQNSISNRMLGWEQTKQTDIGIELGLFQNRIYINADYYNSLTSGLLLNVPVPLITGFSSALQNIGEVRNKGFEFSIDTKNIVKADFQWNSNFNISFNRNKVESMGPTNAPIIVGPRNFFNELAYITEVGQPVGSFYGYVYEGVYKTKAEADADPAKFAGVTAGDMNYKDISGSNGVPDGKLDSYDQRCIGHSNPDFIWGFTNTLVFRGFDLSLTLQGIQGATNLNGQKRNIYRWISGQDRNYWKSEAEPGDGQTPNPGGSNMNRRVSSWWLQDASFLRVKNLTVGYNIPAKVLGKTVSKARVYLNASNLFTFSKYPLYNPEINSGEGDDYNQLTPGLDFGGYPLARTLTLGVNVSF